MKPSVKANLIFLLISAIWGGTFPIIKAALSEASPNYFVFVRFTLAALLMLPFVWRDFRESHKGLVIAGLVLGVLNIVIYAFQTMSLAYISASRCAFITGSFVIMIPFFAAFARLTELSLLDILSAIVCTIGLYILTGANLNGLGIGDLLVFLCAVAYAASVVFLQYLSQKHYSPKLLSFYQIIFTIPFPLVYSYLLESHSSLGGFSFWWGVIYCAVLATILPMTMQTKYQRDTNPTQVALIFAVEPVFAAFFSWMFYGEKLTANIFYGGALILLSLVLPVLGSIIFKKQLLH
ncbi:MAG: transporter drug/metabolite exporter family [Gammaproteobacteria bacterium]|jgi:drug/metabolite transporter (DMT)-like permease|nr:transporter drug/metabolite exporter family [Gammaproteobacteria bacterium]